MAGNRIIGVLWKKQKDGKDYFSGIIHDLHGEINIAVFPNNRKEKDNQPDLNIVISWGDRKGSKEPLSENDDGVTPF